MITRKVVISPEARHDLFEIYDWIAASAGPETAIRFVERLESFCLNLDLASQRGHARDDIRPCLRVVGVDRRASIVFEVQDEQVTIFRVFSAGRDVTSEIT